MAAARASARAANVARAALRRAKDRVAGAELQVFVWGYYRAREGLLLLFFLLFLYLCLFAAVSRGTFPLLPRAAAD